MKIFGLNKFIFISFFYISCKSTVPIVDIGSISHNGGVDDIDTWLSELSLNNHFNGAILISVNGKIELMNTYGYSNLARTKPLTVQSSFRLGSVSKQFTAMAIMILKERGNLSYDDNVKSYLFNFPYEDVTIRHLLTHTSGIPDYESLVLKLKNKSSTKYFYRTGQSKENIVYKGDPSLYKNHHDILTMEDVLNLVIRYSEKRKFLAGDKYQYSNTGYVLLAYIVEKISEQTFESFMDDNIFTPLKMNNSSVWNLNTSSGKLDNRVEGTNKNKLNDYTWMDGVAGDGAVFVSIEDFIKWDESFTNNTIISESTFNESITPFITNNSDTSHYGFGWALDEKDTSIDHAGSWVGAQAYIYKNPQNGLLFVLLDSSTNKYIRKIISAILELIKRKNF